MLTSFVLRMTFLSMAVMIFIVIRNIIYFIQTDHFLEECTSTVYHKEKQLLHYPCLYLDLWKEYNNGRVYDTRHFLDAFFAVATGLALAYIISCVFAMIGISRCCHLTLIPWIAVNIIIICYLCSLILSEVLCKPSEHSLSKYFFIASCSLIYFFLNLVVGIILFFETKRKNKKRNEADQFTYLELHSLHNPSDNLSWF